MTSLAACVSFDARGQSALYLISDSRITWSSTNKRWESGRKTFSAKYTPDIFGYVGSAFLPTVIISQIVEQLDLGLICPLNVESSYRHNQIKKSLSRSMHSLKGVSDSRFSIFHGTRQNNKMDSRFRLWQSDFSLHGKLISDCEINIVKEHSHFAKIAGTGSRVVEIATRNTSYSDLAGTSRSAIGAFCKSLSDGDDPRSGGAPQLVGIYRVEPARTFGFIWRNKKFLSGLEVTRAEHWNKIEWRNSSFERCDGRTGEIMKKAKTHEFSVI